MTPAEALEVIKTITKNKDDLQGLSFSQLEKIISMIDTLDKDRRPFQSSHPPVFTPPTISPKETHYPTDPYGGLTVYS